MPPAASGCLWLAVWGAGEVRRFDPAGRLLARFEVPVSLASSCAFGGGGLRDLFVTTAPPRPDGDDDEPLAGHLFRLPDAGQGLATPRGHLTVQSGAVLLCDAYQDASRTGQGGDTGHDEVDTRVETGVEAEVSGVRGQGLVDAGEGGRVGTCSRSQVGRECVVVGPR